LPGIAWLLRAARIERRYLYDDTDTLPKLFLIAHLPQGLEEKPPAPYIPVLATVAQVEDARFRPLSERTPTNPPMPSTCP
jgi:hypothetical protein